MPPNISIVELKLIVNLLISFSFVIYTTKQKTTNTKYTLVEFYKILNSWQKHLILLTSPNDFEFFYSKSNEFLLMNYSLISNKIKNKSKMVGSFTELMKIGLKKTNKSARENEK